MMKSYLSSHLYFSTYIDAASENWSAKSLKKIMPKLKSTIYKYLLYLKYFKIKI